MANEISRPDWGRAVDSYGGRLTPGSANQAVGVPATTRSGLPSRSGVQEVSLRAREALAPLANLPADELEDFRALIAGVSDEAERFVLAELDRGSPVIRPFPLTEAREQHVRSLEDGAYLWSVWGRGRAGGKLAALEARLRVLRQHPEIAAILDSVTTQQSIAIALGLVGR